MTIPGVTLRPFDPERDYPGITRVIAAQQLADRVQYVPTEASLRNDYENSAGLVPARDVIVAEADGMIVATAAVARGIREGEIDFSLDCAVDPTWRLRGIGAVLLRWQESRARDRLVEQPTDMPGRLTSWVEDTQAGSLALLAKDGFRQVRFGFMMVRDLADPIPEVALPAGLEIRPVEEAQHRAIFEAENEAFRDHWQHRELEDADFVRIHRDPDVDTSLWRVAWDGPDVAAVVVNFIFPEENATLGVQRGWLEHISTRRPWRRRGLASALAVASLHAFRERGLTEAALNVDSENPNGALGLFEGLGFRKVETGIAHRKDL